MHSCRSNTKLSRYKNRVAAQKRHCKLQTKRTYLAAPPPLSPALRGKCTSPRSLTIGVTGALAEPPNDEVCLLEERAAVCFLRENKSDSLWRATCSGLRRYRSYINRTHSKPLVPGPLGH